MGLLDMGVVRPGCVPHGASVVPGPCVVFTLGHRRARLYLHSALPPPHRGCVPSPPGARGSCAHAEMLALGARLA